MHKVFVFVLFLIPVAWAQADDLRSLENLERERARLLQTALDPQMDNVKRQQQLQHQTRTMVDLERMVLRDDRLIGVKDPMVVRAFKHYDLTFLSHAAVEAKLNIVDFWLQSQGLTTDRVRAATVGFR